jgi:tetratricopeptide (TPR) repeat protein
LFEDALEPMERALELGPQIPELWYDHAVINLAAGNHEIALQALEKCIILNPKLKAQAKADSDLDLLHGNVKYEELIK